MHVQSSVESLFVLVCVVVGILAVNTRYFSQQWKGPRIREGEGKGQVGARATVEAPSSFRLEWFLKGQGSLTQNCRKYAIFFHDILVVLYLGP